MFDSSLEPYLYTGPSPGPTSLSLSIRFVTPYRGPLLPLPRSLWARAPLTLPPARPLLLLLPPHSPPARPHDAAAATATCLGLSPARPLLGSALPAGSLCVPGAAATAPSSRRCCCCCWRRLCDCPRCGLPALLPVTE